MVKVVIEVAVELAFAIAVELAIEVEQKPYSSLRKRATGILSCSRYLATVRRAMS